MAGNALRVSNETRTADGWGVRRRVQPKHKQQRTAAPDPVQRRSSDAFRAIFANTCSDRAPTCAVGWLAVWSRGYRATEQTDPSRLTPKMAMIRVGFGVSSNALAAPAQVL